MVVKKLKFILVDDMNKEINSVDILYTYLFLSMILYKKEMYI